MRRGYIGLCLLGFSLPSFAAAATVAQNCSDLAADFATRNVNIVNTTHVAISQLQALFPNATVPLSTSFCRLYGQVNVLNQSTVNFEVWLPDPQFYNGRFLAVGMSPFIYTSPVRANCNGTGNGGLAGIIDESAMLLGVSQGFATAGYVRSSSSSVGADANGDQRRWRALAVSQREWRSSSGLSTTIHAQSRSDFGVDPRLDRGSHRARQIFADVVLWQGRFIFLLHGMLQ
jgi:hypothetical protein